MAFGIPNDPASSVNPAASAVQAQVDSGDIAVLAAGAITGVQSGCAVTAHGGTLGVDVSAGTVIIGGSAVPVAAVSNLTLTAANGSLDRFDIVQVDTNGAVSITAGTAAAAPCYPALSTDANGSINVAVLAAVRVPAAASTIVSGNVVDKRVFVDIAGLTSPSSQLSSFTWFTHSYGLSWAVPMLARTRAGLLSTVCSLVGTDEANVFNLGQSGGSVAGTTALPAAGLKNSTWAAVMQGVVPPTSSQADAWYARLATLRDARADRPAFIFQGLNEISNDINGWSTVGQNAFIGALRAVISRLMASWLAFSTDTSRSVSDSVTNATNIVTSATAAFTMFDVGKTVTGTNIPSNTWIQAVNSATSVVISNSASGSGSGGTLNVVGSIAKTTGFGTTVAGNDTNSGPQVIRSTANADVLTITLPTDVPAGAVLTLGFRTTANGTATISNNPLSSGATGAAAITLNEAGGGLLPASGNYLAQIDGEWLTITGGQGGTSLTVGARGVSSRTFTNITIANASPNITSSDAAFKQTDVGRGISGTNIPASTTILSVTNSTTAVLSANATGTGSGTYTIGGATSHAQNARVKVAQNYRVDLGGTAANASGSLVVAAQGQGNLVGYTCKRIALSAADSAKTVTVTTAGFISGDNGTIDFDSWWIEAPQPPPIIVCNLPVYPITFTTTAYLTAYANTNTAIASLAQEFTVGNVAVCDANAVMTGRNLTVGGSGITTAPAAGTSETWTFTAGARGYPNANAGFRIRVDTEDMWVTAVSGTSLTVIRGFNNTTPATHSLNATAYDASLFANENIHPNSLGNIALGQAMVTTMAQTMRALDYRTIGIGHKHTRNPGRGMMHVPDGGYITIPATLVGRQTPAVGQVYAHPVFIDDVAIVKAMGCNVTTGGSAGSVMRFGIYTSLVTNGQPSDLIADFGAVATTGTGWTEQTGLWLRLEPGVYWLACCPQTAAPTVTVIGSTSTYAAPAADPDFAGALKGGICFPVPSDASSRQASVGGFLGYLGASGITGALPQSFGTLSYPFGTQVPKLQIGVRSHHFA